MAAFNKFRCFVEDVGRKVHNLNADTLKIALTNTAPVATNSVLADITEIAAAFGYSAGGTAIAANAYSQAAGIGKLTGSDVVFTAAGGTMGTFRYMVIYNSTPAAKNLIGWWDHGSAVILLTGQAFTVDFSAVNGILQLA